MVSAAVVEPIMMQAHLMAVHLDEGRLFDQLGEKGGSDSAH
jgi:hypothetical protein